MPANPAATPGVAAAAEAAKSSGVDEAFELKVKSLEENVNELKEKIFRTKARLLLLQETVLGGVRLRAQRERGREGHGSG